jgi:hypothetical protein
MKTKEFSHYFDVQEEIQEGLFTQPKVKYDISYDYEDGRVYDIYCSIHKKQDWKIVDYNLPGNIYKVCEQDLAETK